MPPTPPTPRELGALVIELCKRQSFALAGICDARPSERADQLKQWLAEGRHGSMAWLANHVEQRVSPQEFFPGARSMILVADQYAAPGDSAAPNPPAHGKIARYARGDDYHTVMKKRLHALCDALRSHIGEAPQSSDMRAFVDTAPVLEREHAARAGLGWIGKHTLLIHPDRGSYLLLGGIVTSALLEAPETQRPITDHCGTCTRCIDACPTKAITPYAVDATKCISYLTIEHREPIDPSMHAGIGEWLFGCDICQEVCPHNREREYGEAITPHEAYAPVRNSFDLLEVLNWTEDDRRRECAGSSMKRAKLDMMKRNAGIVLENSRRGDERTGTSGAQGA